VHGILDLADAIALESALQAGAAALEAEGSDESLDVRRAREPRWSSGRSSTWPANPS